MGKYILAIAVSLAVIAISAFGILNTMVSLKYEVKEYGDCISQTSGRDLCLTIDILIGIIVISILGIVFSTYKLIKRNSRN
ncbi:hypothetical protein HYN59_05595 [Flavobacterium album]|uniref:Uncharacterized protein n=1 Tax=Flavobacterium album TaxID=2175091 RepID=A0A2S1QW64_9FLAO|nr:hypothetical protein [Flavobacterium album]AWH84623.1 hypothetical protein HYN59_05595 [Flavobacterium album]